MKKNRTRRLDGKTLVICEMLFLAEKALAEGKTFVACAGLRTLRRQLAERGPVTRQALAERFKAEVDELRAELARAKGERHEEE